VLSKQQQRSSPIAKRLSNFKLVSQGLIGGSSAHTAFAIGLVTLISSRRLSYPVIAAWDCAVTRTPTASAAASWDYPTMPVAVEVAPALEREIIFGSS